MYSKTCVLLSASEADYLPFYILSDYLRNSFYTLKLHDVIKGCSRLNQAHSQNLVSLIDVRNGAPLEKYASNLVSDAVKRLQNNYV